jgi:hypothetical protein
VVVVEEGVQIQIICMALMNDTDSRPHTQDLATKGTAPQRILLGDLLPSRIIRLLLLKHAPETGTFLFYRWKFILTPPILCLVKQLALVQIIKRDFIQKVFLVISDLCFMMCTRNELIYKTKYGGRHY